MSLSTDRLPNPIEKLHALMLEEFHLVKGEDGTIGATQFNDVIAKCKLHIEEYYSIVSTDNAIIYHQPHNFKVDDRVVYIPEHANRNRDHQDCEYGIVSKVDKDKVWVRYGGNQTGSLSPVKNLFHQ